jgi:hypothetical protein
LARNSSSQSNAEIKSDSEFIFHACN